MHSSTQYPKIIIKYAYSIVSHLVLTVLDSDIIMSKGQYSLISLLPTKEVREEGLGTRLGSIYIILYNVCPKKTWDNDYMSHLRTLLHYNVILHGRSFDTVYMMLNAHLGVFKYSYTDVFLSVIRIKIIHTHCFPNSRARAALILGRVGQVGQKMHGVTLHGHLLIQHTCMIDAKYTPQCH